MKSQARLDREIAAVTEYVNSFPSYDPENAYQMRGFDLLEALQWVRGRLHKKSPTERLKLKEGDGRL